MQPIRLFDLPDLAADEPEPPPASYGRRLTARNKRLIANGWNPATHLPLLGGDETCGSCAYAIPTGRGHRTYWKCLKNPRGMTRGLRTDIRLKWPACLRWAAKEAPSEGTGVPSEGP